MTKEQFRLLVRQVLADNCDAAVYFHDSDRKGLDIAPDECWINWEDTTIKIDNMADELFSALTKSRETKP